MRSLQIAGMIGNIRIEGALRTIFAPTDAAINEMRDNDIGAQIINSNTEFTHVRITLVRLTL